jgi:acetylornithine deacetylase/succinyl-diaminopimelate desuccinylase-like protein
VDAVAAALRHARFQQQATLDRLGAFVRFPTVSADPRCSADMHACALWLARLLRRIGLSDVRVREGRVAPVVTATWRGRPGRPTMLIYGHYDVQPAGPQSAWSTDPFLATRAGPYVRGRGVSDDKGQLLAHLAAIEAWLVTSARLPLNLRLVLDGEEEIGSPTLVAAARDWPELAADVALVSDTWMLGPNTPVLITALRGAMRICLEVAGPMADLHAGSFGGAVADPASVLAHVVAGIHSQSGKVAVPGFYDQVRAMTTQDRRRLSDSGPSDAELLAPAGVPGRGEPGFSAFERVTRRPAVVVTNLRTSGSGRTVVPAWAAADLNIRLVGDQEPAAVARVLRQHFRSRFPYWAHGRLLIAESCPPYGLDRQATVIRAVRAACRRVYGRDPAMLPSGGSIPFVSTLAAARGVDVALLGFGLPTDGAHAPNECFYLPNLFRGIEACIELYQQLARQLMPAPPSLVEQELR